LELKYRFDSLLHGGVAAMKVTEEYRENARACLELSRKSSSLDVQAHWLAMAQYWFDLADSSKAVTGVNALEQARPLKPQKMRVKRH